MDRKQQNVLWAVGVVVLVGGLGVFSWMQMSAAREASKPKEPLVLFEDSAPVQKILSDKFGPDVPIKRLTIDSSSAEMYVKPGDRVERYMIGNSGLMRRGGGVPRAAGLFPMSEVDFTLVPDIVDKAQELVGKPYASPSNLTVERGDDGVVAWTVRTYGHAIRYDLKGNQLGEPETYGAVKIEHVGAGATKIESVGPGGTKIESVGAGGTMIKQVGPDGTMIEKVE